jgi:hypothetical protein
LALALARVARFCCLLAEAMMCSVVR